MPAFRAEDILLIKLFDKDLAAAFTGEMSQGNFDVIPDFVWGHPTEVILSVLTGHDFIRVPERLRLIEIGEMAGPTITLTGAALRSSGVEIYGSGGGGIIPPKVVLETMPKVWELAIAGKPQIDVVRVPLSDVEKAWQRNDLNGKRIMVIP